MPMQTSINAQLGKRVGSPFTAAMINFMVGWTALLIVTLIWEHSLMIPVGAIAAAPPWVCFGGAFAVVFVTGNIITAQTVGTGMAVVILVDQFGMFRSARRPVGWKEVAGVVVMVIGATMFYLA